MLKFKKSKKSNSNKEDIMQNAKLSTPWEIYRRKLEALFGQDPDIKLDWDGENRHLKMYVSNNEKANALTQLLPDTQMFGNVKFTLTIIPENVEGWRADLVETAFEGNPAFVRSEKIIDPMLSNSMCFIVFKKEVVQYYSDDMSDIHGLTSTLYQDLSKELIGEHEGVYYCTDNK